MQKTEYKVYWTECGSPHSKGAFSLNEVLAITESLRKRRIKDGGIKFITLVSENVDMVGQAGVDEVKNGCTPDGESYDWQKRRSDEK